MTMLTHQELVQQYYSMHSVKRAQDWNVSPGLEYWFVAGEDYEGATTEGNHLPAHGWTVTGAPPYVEGSAADFLSADDKGVPSHANLDTAEDVILSPAMFGDYSHGLMACMLINRMAGDGSPDLPRFLVADFYFALAANANETGTGIGFVEDGGSPAVANDHLAAIFCDGTDFKLRSDAATSSAILTADTGWHHGRIVIDKINALAYGYVDDMNKSAAQSIAIKADEFPVGFGAGVVAAGTNDPKLAWFRLRYGWHGWQ